MSVNISEIFVSLQGEGFKTGTPSIFIRTAGCNFFEDKEHGSHPCHWCDSSFAWKREGKEYSDTDIINEIERLHIKTGVNNVVLTGGEPLFAETKDLITYCSKHYNLTVETNGSLPIWHESCLWSVSFKGPSSGNQEYNNYDNIRLLDYNSQLKFVIANREDFEWAKDIINSYCPMTNIVFQPAYKLMSPNKLIKWVMKDKELSWQVRVLNQMHKTWFKPGRRGV